MNQSTRSFFLGLFVSVACLFNLTIAYAGETANDKSEGGTVKILTVGNSFADNACTYLQQITESVPGFSIEITKANLGGCSLERHASLIEACKEDDGLKPYSNTYCLGDLLKKDTYDFVTIQQVSSLSFTPESFEPYAEVLIQFIREHAHSSEIMIHQTWAYGADSPRLKEWEMSREEMHNGLVKNYQVLAERYGLDILPSGGAFYKATLKSGNIDLWGSDRYHANMNGCYLAGCVWFGKLFGVSPQKIKFIPEGMDPDTARFLQKVAAKEIITKTKRNRLK
jgi:hypothetical protein